MGKQWAWVNIRCGGCGDLTRSSSAAWSYHGKRKCGHCGLMMVSKSSRHIDKGGEVNALDIIPARQGTPGKSRGWPIKKSELAD